MLTFDIISVQELFLPMDAFRQFQYIVNISNDIDIGWRGEERRWNYWDDLPALNI